MPSNTDFAPIFIETVMSDQQTDQFNFDVPIDWGTGDSPFKDTSAEDERPEIFNMIHQDDDTRIVNDPGTDTIDHSPFARDEGRADGEWVYRGDSIVDRGVTFESDPFSDDVLVG
ncbi:MAG: hypothetical protein AAF674_22775 [Pseudomonadota bacterium]